MQIVLKDELAEPLQEMVDGVNYLNVTQIVNIATKEFLEKLGGQNK